MNQESTVVDAERNPTSNGVTSAAVTAREHACFKHVRVGAWRCMGTQAHRHGYVMEMHGKMHGLEFGDAGER